LSYGESLGVTDAISVMGVAGHDVGNAKEREISTTVKGRFSPKRFVGSAKLEA
jgi:hypothetical protein